MDLRNATLAPSPDSGAIGRKAAEMIREEVEKRTQLRVAACADPRFENYAQQTLWPA